jgi:hypothetical protein
MLDDNVLNSNGIKRRKVKGCVCNSTAFIYNLPIPLDDDVLKYVNCMGNPCISFEKTSLLKIETIDFSIIGLKRLKEIRFTVKTENGNNLLDKFENSLILFVASKK